MYIQNMAGERGDHEGFHKFFERWLEEQNRDLEQLVAAVKHHRGNGGDDGRLRPLIERVMEHYEHYYKVKSRYGKQDIMGMLSPSWRSRMEDAFLWIGGWRPTMAFHLLYSKSGLQLEARLSELLKGLKTGDLGDLSPEQLGRIDELQRNAIKEEKELSEKLAQLQESVADSAMVELSHVVTELMRAGESGKTDAEEEGRVASMMAPKENALTDILQKADDLRLGTLKRVVEILNSVQAADFLIAAAELHLRFHEWGMKRDHNSNSSSSVVATSHHRHPIGPSQETTTASTS